MISLRELRAIVRHYPADYQPTRIEPLGSAGGMSGAQFWRIESPRGTLMLRRWPTEHPSVERLRIIHRVLFHAAERGITFLAIPIRTTSGDSFIRDSGHLWELNPWMPGVADYERSPTTEKLRAAMMALAQFHEAVADFPLAMAESAAGEVPAISQRLARLKELSTTGTRELTQAITDEIWPELGPLARRFLAALPKCLPRALDQLAPLANVSLPLQPCLRDIWHDHVLFSGDKVTGIIDFGAVNIDTPAADIARLLGSLVGDNPAGPQSGLAAYSAVRPLSQEEVQATMALDTAAIILAGCNWLRWIYVEGRDFENHDKVIERFRRIVERCANVC